jgi:hypothetical protein
VQIDDEGGHDSLVGAALAKLPDIDHGRVLRDVDAFIAGLHEVHAAERSGSSVAPTYRRPLLDQLRAEARRRETCGDPTAAVWSALADATALREAVEHMTSEIA